MSSRLMRKRLALRRGARTMAICCLGPGCCGERRTLSWAFDLVILTAACTSVGRCGLVGECDVEGETHRDVLRRREL